MFRNNPVGSALVSALLILALLTCWISVNYFFTLRELYAIQVRHQSMQRTLNGVQNLVSETLLYSQRHPEIDPILQDLGIKPRSSVPGPPAPKLPR